MKTISRSKLPFLWLSLSSVESTPSGDQQAAPLYPREFFTGTSRDAASSCAGSKNEIYLIHGRNSM